MAWGQNSHSRRPFIYLIVTAYLLCAKHLRTPWLAKRNRSLPSLREAYHMVVGRRYESNNCKSRCKVSTVTSAPRLCKRRFLFYWRGQGGLLWGSNLWSEDWRESRINKANKGRGTQAEASYVSEGSLASRWDSKISVVGARSSNCLVWDEVVAFCGPDQAGCCGPALGVLCLSRI